MIIRKYKCLKIDKLEKNNFKIVPIRDLDKFEIMQMRNEQIYHLRQKELLTDEKQIYYFKNVVSKLFEVEYPEQLLFSYLDEKENYIGYGGLVHICWEDKRAEISFGIKSILEPDFFEFHWSNFLFLIKKIAFENLKFNKIYTYAFDIRPHLYPILEKNGFKLEAILEKHCIIDAKFYDVKIHCIFNTNNYDFI